MNTFRPDNPFDAMRRVIEHEANQDDDGGFFAKLGGIDPEPDDDGPTAKGLFQHMDLNRNSYAYLYDPKVMPKKSAIDYLIDAFKDAFTVPFKPKRQPIIRIRRIWVQAPFQTWHWQCTKCDHHMKPREIGSTYYGELCFTWETAYRRATRHAHNHHRSEK